MAERDDAKDTQENIRRRRTFFERFPRQKRVLFAAQLSRVAHLQREREEIRFGVWLREERGRDFEALLAPERDGTNV